jgi:hypothetical protein
MAYIHTLTLRSSRHNVFLGISKSRFGGTNPFLSIMIALMRPATPLDASKCPMFDLTEPTMSSFSRLTPSQKTLAIDDISALSPT